MNRFFRLAAAIFAAVALAAPVFAQSAATGSVEGVITDSSGAVLPGVSVIVRNTETNIQRDAVTDSGGRYRATA